MTDDKSETKIEIELPGEDPQPPEYQKMVDFGERVREEFSDYSWNLSTLVGTDGEPVTIPILSSCIESGFRIQVAEILESANFPQEVYDVPSVDADFVVSDQDLGQEEIAVSVSATDADNTSARQTAAPSSKTEEHWEITLRYRIPESEPATADAISSSSISIKKR